MALRPDFSPSMLRAFLRARIAHAALAKAALGHDTGRADERRALSRILVADTGLSRRQIADAMAGRLLAGAARCALWRALGASPSDHGFVLCDEGGQHRACDWPIHTVTHVQGGDDDPSP